MTKPVSFSTGFSSSNYIDFGGTIESFNTLNASLKTGIVTTSVGVGIDSKTSLNPLFQGSTSQPAIEAKVKCNITNNLNAQARFRKIGEAEQYRVTFGGSYKFDNNSIYSSVHLTTKNSNNQWSTNTGAWLGFTHDFEGCSISAEVQQNIPLKGLSSSQNKREINTSDTMVNVIVSIPF